MNKQGGSDLFWATFVGEYVTVLCSVEDPSSPSKAMLAVKGYFLDADDTFYYFGVGPLEVDLALKKSVVNLIEILKEVDPDLEVLENLPIPVKEEEKN